jgi:hypothetical protein
VVTTFDEVQAALAGAERTPAWVEPYVEVVDRWLVEHRDAAADERAEMLEIRESMVGRCPQIVDVDRSALSLTRAHWEGEYLYLTLAPLVERPSLHTTFRLVGVEPRIWCMVGIDGATTDVSARSVVIRTPLVAGVIEFAPGSY